MQSTWSDAGAVPLRGAKRNCCRWNQQEKIDLERAWRHGATMPQLAQTHQRTWNGVEAQLCRQLNCSADALEDRRMTGRWVSKDGRVTAVDRMDLDHLINSCHDMNYRVMLLRHGAARALGLNNANVNEATRQAFEKARAPDVFPLYESMAAQARAQFARTYDVQWDELREMIMAAWKGCTAIPARLRPAVEFVLKNGQNKAPPRFLEYAMTFRPQSEDRFRRMCWTLRMDQPKVCRYIADHPVTRDRTYHVNPRTAMNFQPNMRSLDLYDDVISF